MADEKTEPTESTPFEKFERLARKVIAVPKTEIARREAEWKKRQKAKKGSS